MQILVRDIFRLQSLQTAHLIAGREGILRPLCGGTILEMTELGRDNASELLSFSFKPQEIMITALYNVKNDVESQCDVPHGYGCVPLHSEAAGWRAWILPEHLVQK